MFLTRDQVRDVDRIASEKYGVPTIVLMENAGRGAAELLMRLGVHAPVVICCGKGNNGGDGFVIARHLDNVQIPVKVLLFAEPDKLRGDAKVNFDIVQKAGVEIVMPMRDAVDEARLRNEFAGAEWLVDALFGTGLGGAVRAPFDTIIGAMNQSGLPIFAVDIPSGLDCDTGQPLGTTIQARHTATFVAEKTGFAHVESSAWTGQVHVIDIGAPRACLEE